MATQDKELKKLKAAELLRRCGEDEEAIQELLPLLNAADPKIAAEAYYNLGLIAEHPEKGRRNIPQAIEYYQKAIDLGYPDAAEELGTIHYYRKSKIYADQSWDGYNIERAIENLKIYAERSPEFGNQELDKLYSSGKHKIPKHLFR